MGKFSRDKGARGEREIVNILKSYGVPAKRISMMETTGVDKGDVEIAEIWTAQVKLGSQVPKFLYDARINGEEFLFCRRDKQRWAMVIDLEWFLEHFWGNANV